MAKATRTIKTAVTGSVLTITVDGIAEPIVVDVGAFSPEQMLRAAIHGSKQRVCDAAAISRDTASGASASPAEKHEAMAAVAAALNAGTWTVAREATGSELYRAMREAFPTSANVATAEAFAAYVKKAAEAKKSTEGAVRNGLAAIPAVKTILDRFAAERAKAAGDVSELLADFAG